jgi:hypothetical protein
MSQQPQMGEGALVSIATESMTATLRPVLDDFAARLAAKPEVAGVVVLGGLSKRSTRRFADRFSDLDVVFYLSLPGLPEALLRKGPHEFIAGLEPYLPKWLPNFKFNVPPEESGLDWPVPIDVNQQVLEYEEQERVSWDWHTLESYANNAEVVYDPTGRVQRLVDTKLGNQEAELDRFVLKILAFGRVLTDTVIEQCVRREEYAVGHATCNELLHDMTTAWYAVNGRFAPFTKWRIANIVSLAWTPADAVARYNDLLLVHSHDAADLYRRRDGTAALLDELEAHCKQTRKDWPDDAYTYAVHHVFIDRQLREFTGADRLPSVHGLGQNDKMKISEWNRWNWLLRDDEER